jgi:hypothetical protein
MPLYQALLSELNERFGPDRIAGLDPATFSEGVRLSDLVSTTVPLLATALDALPPAIHDSIRAVIRSAVLRQLPITFAWAPGYDYRLSVWDVASSATSRGGLTVLIETRYPDDPHPLHGTMGDAAAAARA